MNRVRLLFWPILLFSFLPQFAHAQAWSGILDPTRAIDWSKAGAGAIPARTTICSTLGSPGQAPTFVQSVTVSQINAALSSCSTGQTVLLNPGTYNTAGGTIRIPSNVTLRGSGPTRTIIAETNTPSSGPLIPIIQFGTQSSHPYGPEPNSGTSTAITGGTAQGSTQITVASTSGISVGTLLVLSQNDLSYMTDVGDEGACSYCQGVGGNSGQTVQVTAISGNTLTISDPLYIGYTNSPLAYPFSVGCTHAGLENLHIYASGAQTANGTGFGYSPNINMTGTIYSWVKNVESDFADGDHMQILFSMHNTVRDSFFHDGFNHGPGTADDAVKLNYKVSANLIENNIFWRQHSSLMLQWGASGNVISYNYSTGNIAGAGSDFLLEDFSFHGAHPMMNLFEGNVTTHYQQDSIHGSSSHSTIFRNYSTGTNINLAPTDNRGALQIGSPIQDAGGVIGFSMDHLAQYNNMVGVINGSDYPVNTLSVISRAVAPNNSSYGSGPACISVGFVSASDSYSSPNNADTTMLYQGVMDCKAGTFQWENGVQTLPASFYLSAKPGWWGSVAWPPIGPDVTGGNFSDWVNATATAARGHVNKIPAINCFNSSTSKGTTNVTTFDANVCYASGASATVPAPPTGLSAVVQ
jgi:hypothetical protein